MSVVQSLEEVGPCRRQLAIEVPKAAVDAETERVVQSFRKGVNIAGFRKGKAPLALVRKQFASDIRQEVLDRLMPRYWKQAEAEKQLQVLTAPRVEEVDFQLGDAMRFTASVEVRPEVTLGDIENFDFPVVATEPTDEEVESEVTAMRRRFGDWKEVDRAAAQGDLVKIHIRKGDAEEEDPLTLEVGEERVWEEISLAVSGLKAGQKSTFERAEPPSEEGAEPEKVQYAVRVEKVEERVLPDLTDEWVKEATELESVAELTERLRGAIAHRMADQARRTRQHALLQQLRERHPIALPEEVVMDEVESMLRHYAENLARQGVDIEKQEFDWPAMAERMRPQAEQSVHADLLLDAIADAKEIEAPAEKLEGALAQIAAARQTTALNVRRALDSEGRLEKLQRQIRRDEVVETLLGGSNVESSNGDEVASSKPQAKAKAAAKPKKKAAPKKKEATKKSTAKKTTAKAKAAPKKTAKATKTTQAKKARESDPAAE